MLTDLSAEQSSASILKNNVIHGNSLALPENWIKPLAARVRWYWECSNSPTLELLLDQIPENFIYTQKDHLYYGLNRGIVRFFAYQKPGEGFGGSHFHIQLDTGEQKTLKGPWSSRAGVMNDAGFHPCLDVLFTDAPKVWNSSHGTFYAGHVALAVAAAALPLVENVPQIGDGKKNTCVLVKYDGKYIPAVQQMGGGTWLKI